MPKYRAQIWTSERTRIEELEAFNIESAARTIKKENPSHRGFKIEEVIKNE